MEPEDEVHDRNKAVAAVAAAAGESEEDKSGGLLLSEHEVSPREALDVQVLHDGEHALVPEPLDLYLQEGEHELVSENKNINRRLLPDFDVDLDGGGTRMETNSLYFRRAKRRRDQ